MTILKPCAGSKLVKRMYARFTGLDLENGSNSAENFGFKLQKRHTSALLDTVVSRTSLKKQRDPVDLKGQRCGDGERTHARARCP